MHKEYPIHWLEKIINKILNKNLLEITLATGKTPSGHIHIGILRELIICDSIRRKLEEYDKKVNFFLFIDSLDAAKRFPEYIEKTFTKKYLGKPFSKIPCPFDESDCKSYSDYFGTELISTFKQFGIKVDIIWTHELYQDSIMKDKIRISLNNTDKIKEIVRKNILPTLDEKNRKLFIDTQKDWFPAMVICEKCGKMQKIDDNNSIQPNRVLSYDKNKDTVSFSCTSCGNSGEIPINKGELKLNWRVDWPAKWAIFKTTCEPAGKDHSVKGGSYDTGLEICKTIFNYDGPIKLSYEWLRLGDQDMKTSKGIIFTPKKYLEIANPEILRMLFLRTLPNKHISFRLEELYQLYDYYEKMENVYYNIERVSSETEEKFLKYIYPLCQTNSISTKKPLRLPFKYLTTIVQLKNILKIEEIYEKARKILKYKGFDENLPFNDFETQLNRAEKWINEIKYILKNEKNESIKRKIMNKVTIFEVPDTVSEDIKSNLSPTQKLGIKMLKMFLISNKDLIDEVIQNKIFDIAKNDLKIKPQKFFKVIYLILIGKEFGPRLGPFLLMLDKVWLINRLSIE